MYKIMAKFSGDKRFKALSIDSDGAVPVDNLLNASFWTNRSEADAALDWLKKTAEGQGVAVELKVVRQS
jgi:hypothetical protein